MEDFTKTLELDYMAALHLKLDYKAALPPAPSPAPPLPAETPKGPALQALQSGSIKKASQNRQNIIQTPGSKSPVLQAIQSESTMAPSTSATASIATLTPSPTLEKQATLLGSTELDALDYLALTIVQNPAVLVATCPPSEPHGRQDEQEEGGVLSQVTCKNNEWQVTNCTSRVPLPWPNFTRPPDLASIQPQPSSVLTAGKFSGTVSPEAITEIIDSGIGMTKATVVVQTLYVTANVSKAASFVATSLKSLDKVPDTVSLKIATKHRVECPQQYGYSQGWHLCQPGLQHQARPRQAPQ